MEFNRSDNCLTMRETKTKILFRAVEEFERLRGSNLAWFGVDELTYTSEQGWLRLEGRLRDPKAHRLCGFAVWTPKGYDWVYERFVARQIEGYETVTASPFENRFLLEKIPDYYERLRSSYDERFFKQEALGEYLSLHAGRVYYAFERLGNVVEAKVDRSKPLLWALDFNVDPMCSVGAQFVEPRVRVLDEIVLSRASTQQACEEVRAPVSRGHRGRAWCVFAGCDWREDADDGDNGCRDLEGILPERGVWRGEVPHSEDESGREGPGGADERQAGCGRWGASPDGAAKVHGADQGSGAGYLQGEQPSDR